MSSIEVPFSPCQKTENMYTSCWQLNYFRRDYAELQISERKTRNFAMLHFLLLYIHYEACHHELRQQIQWLALTDPFSVNIHLDLWQKREIDKVAMDKRPMLRSPCSRNSSRLHLSLTCFRLIICIHNFSISLYYKSTNLIPSFTLWNHKHLQNNHRKHWSMYQISKHYLVSPAHSQIKSM